MAKYKSSYKLNPKNDRYRVCPECITPFMTTHRGRDFCDDKCGDDYNNRNKRLISSAAEIISSKEIDDGYRATSPSIPFYSGTVPAPDMTKVISEVNTPTAKKSIDQSTKETNNAFFSEILNGKKEVEVYLMDISDSQFNIDSYDSIEKLPNCNLNKANYGNYSIVWSQADKILITSQTQLLWTSL